MPLVIGVPLSPRGQVGTPIKSSPKSSGVVVSIEATDGTAIEPGFDSGMFTVRRTGSTIDPLNVRFTVGGTAEKFEYKWFADAGENVLIPAGASSVTMVVTPIDDNEIEGDETVIVTLITGLGYDVSEEKTALITVQDDESLPPLYAPITAKGESREALVAKWTGLFGPVPFDEEHLFSAMSYVQPQPDGAFQHFTTETTTRPHKLELPIWAGEFFKAPFADFLMRLSPSKYYLNHGRIEPSLLRYEFVVDRRIVVMLENYNFFFFIVKPATFSASKPVSSDDVSDLIFKWIQVKGTNRADVAQRFGLPKQLRVGDVFTNRSQPHLHRIQGGQDHVIGFISTQGICLMVPKAQAGRQAAGFNVDYNWANRQIFEADATTRMDHPKYFKPER